MPPKPRTMLFSLAALLAAYAAAGLVAGHAVRAWSGLPDWLEDLCFGVFIAPLLVLCRPWFPLLAKLGLMQGRLVQVPTAAGTLLVIGFYALILVIAGILVGRRRR